MTKDDVNETQISRTRSKSAAAKEENKPLKGIESVLNVKSKSVSETDKEDPKKEASKNEFSTPKSEKDKENQKSAKRTRAKSDEDVSRNTRGNSDRKKKVENSLDKYFSPKSSKTPTQSPKPKKPRIADSPKARKKSKNGSITMDELELDDSIFSEKDDKIEEEEPVKGMNSLLNVEIISNLRTETESDDEIEFIEEVKSPACTNKPGKRTRSDTDSEDKPEGSAKKKKEMKLDKFFSPKFASSPLVNKSPKSKNPLNKSKLIDKFDQKSEETEIHTSNNKDVNNPQNKNKENKTNTSLNTRKSSLDKSKNSADKSESSLSKTSSTSEESLTKDESSGKIRMSSPRKCKDSVNKIKDVPNKNKETTSKNKESTIKTKSKDTPSKSPIKNKTSPSKSKETPNKCKEIPSKNKLNLSKTNSNSSVSLEDSNEEKISPNKNKNNSLNKSVNNDKQSVSSKKKNTSTNPKENSSDNNKETSADSSINKNKDKSEKSIEKASLNSASEDPDISIIDDLKLDESNLDDSKIGDSTLDSSKLADQSSTSLNMTNDRDKSTSSTPKRMNLTPVSAKKKTAKQLAKEAEKMKRQEEREQKRLELQKKKQEIEELKRQKREEETKRKEEKRKKEEEEKQKKEEERAKREEERKKKEEEKEEEKKRKEEEKKKRDEEKRKKDEEKRKKDEEKRLAEEEERQKKEKNAAKFKGFFLKKEEGGKMSCATEELPASSGSKLFMQFQIRDNMYMAPLYRNELTPELKSAMDTYVCGDETPADQHTYIDLLKNGKHKPLKAARTLPQIIKKDKREDFCEIIDDDQDDEEESIMQEVEAMVITTTTTDSDDKTKASTKAKLLQFCENNRPAYWGTWSKISKHVGPRKPFGQDLDLFNYDYDSDEDWEEEEAGESLSDSEGEDKDESMASKEEDNYEVDNEFFVPHGYLSDDEGQEADGDAEDGVDLDGEGGSAKPELKKDTTDQTEQLKRKQQEFEAELMKPTKQLKPRVIGCMWMSGNGLKHHEQIKKILSTYQAITWIDYPIPLVQVGGGSPEINKNEDKIEDKSKTYVRHFPEKAVPALIKLIHGNRLTKIFLSREFAKYWKDLGAESDDPEIGGNISLKKIESKIQEIGQYTREVEEQSLKYKAWVVKKEIRTKYNLENIDIENTWEYTLKPKERKDETQSNSVLDTSSDVTKASSKPNENLITKFAKVLTEEEKEEKRKQLAVVKVQESKAEEAGTSTATTGVCESGTGAGKVECKTPAGKSQVKKIDGSSTPTSSKSIANSLKLAKLTPKTSKIIPEISKITPKTSQNTPQSSKTCTPSTPTSSIKKETDSDSKSPHSKAAKTIQAFFQNAKEKTPKAKKELKINKNGKDSSVDEQEIITLD